MNPKGDNENKSEHILGDEHLHSLILYILRILLWKSIIICHFQRDFQIIFNMIAIQSWLNQTIIKSA